MVANSRSCCTKSDRLVELAEIKCGQKVLDIATGIGEPAITAARKLAGSGNNIDGTIKGAI
jgi:ubiquinone/menaquinone biosynthesis C-methylase UbiE